MERSEGENGSIVYAGTIRNKPAFTLRLIVHPGAEAGNKYIKDGHPAELSVIFPALDDASGSDSLDAGQDESFACGKRNEIGFD